MPDQEAKPGQSEQDPFTSGRLTRYLSPGARPEPYTEAELDWAHEVQRRILLLGLIGAAASVTLFLGAVVATGIAAPYWITPGVFFVGLYALLIRRTLRKLDEAVEERRAQLRAFIQEHP